MNVNPQDGPPFQKDDLEIAKSILALPEANQKRTISKLSRINGVEILLSGNPEQDATALAVQVKAYEMNIRRVLTGARNPAVK